MAKSKSKTFRSSRQARKARQMSVGLREDYICAGAEVADSPLDQPEVPAAVAGITVGATLPTLTLDAANALAGEVVAFYARRLQEQTGDTPEVRRIKALGHLIEAHQVVNGAILPGADGGLSDLRS